jgi:hypothetical protein
MEPSTEVRLPSLIDWQNRQWNDRLNRIKTVWDEADGMKLAIFALSSALGYLLKLYLPEGAWATYVPILVTYHVFLVWLVFTADHKAGFSLPIFSTILTHLACLTVVVSLGVGRHYIPFFWLVRYFIPALAPFEAAWLFSGGRKNEEDRADAAMHPAAASATAEDYEEWLRYLKKRNPLTVKAGMTLKDEYEQFMVARIKSRPAIPSTDHPA